MDCPSCRTANPESASFCFKCGTALRGADASRYGRGGAYAASASENVTQLALISTIMPHTSRRVADNYRWALLVTSVIVVGLTLAGILPAAILAAAFLVPLTYLVYIYDVNLWEDAPGPVTAGLFVFTGLLAVGVSLVFFRWVFDGQFHQLGATAGGGRTGLGTTFPLVPILIFAVLLPIVSEVAKQLGPLVLAARPQFDDMVDGLTFGIASGAAYAALETVIVFLPVFTSGQLRTTDNLMFWLFIVLNQMVVKSLIYGTATGIAVAQYSGLGEGYDGLTKRYYRSFAFAALANIVYWLGVHILARAPFGVALGLLWGLIVLAFLVIRVRIMLHTALLEAAVEDAAREAGGKRATGASGGFCPECEMPLLPGALFCIVCGTSVRAASHVAQRGLRGPSEGGAA